MYFCALSTFMKLVFATNNPNKLQEVQEILAGHIELLSLKDIGCFEEIAETATTLEGNAKIKANHITKHSISTKSRIPSH